MNQAAFRHLIDRLRAYFLTQDGKPRGERFTGTPFNAADCDTDDAWRRHRATAATMAPLVADAIRGFRRDLNAVMSRGVWRIFAVALRQYQGTLESHALLDFSGVLERAIKLLKDLDEFAESRLRIESRYRHVLVDEFQDTSRAQWDLVRHLVKGWGEGFGAADDALPPSIFIVGDRKQSIYGFRDADVAVVDEAALFVQALRPDGGARHAITQSFRSVPEILAFVNEVFAEIVAGEPTAARRDAFRFGADDRFPNTARDLENPPNLGTLRTLCRSSPLKASRPLLVWLRTRSCACWPEPSCGTGRLAHREKRVRPTSPSSSARAIATATSRPRSKRAASRRMSTRASDSSTPTKSRTRSRCCGISLTHCRICVPPRSCDRGSSACRIARSPGSRTTPRPSSWVPRRYPLWQTRIVASWSACEPRWGRGCRRSIE